MTTTSKQLKPSKSKKGNHVLPSSILLKEKKTVFNQIKKKKKVAQTSISNPSFFCVCVCFLPHGYNNDTFYPALRQIPLHGSICTVLMIEALQCHLIDDVAMLKIERNDA